MIWESEYWKEPLLEMADRLMSFKLAKQLSEENLVQIEKDILIGFFSIRKLIETPTKVTDATKAIMLPVTWFPAKVDAHINWMNLHRITEHYDTSSSRNEARDLPFVCGCVIHSLILFPEVTENGGLGGVLFTSDKKVDQRLYSISVDTVIMIFRAVGRDYPSKISWPDGPVQ